MQNGGHESSVTVARLQAQTDDWLSDAKHILGIEPSLSILAPHAFARKTGLIVETLQRFDADISQAPKFIADANQRQQDSLRRLMIASLVICGVIVLCIVFVVKRFVADVDRIVAAMKLSCAGELDFELSDVERTGDLARLFNGIVAFRRALISLVEAESRNARIAESDPLTAVYNRRYLMAHQKALASTMEHEAVFVLKIDLDKFKHVNDTFGHAAGDHYLVNTVNALRRMLRPDDVLARLGGDEFAIVLSSADAERRWQDLLNRMLKRLEEPVLYRGQLIDRSISVGVSARPHDGKTIDELLASADVALYEGKARGRGCGLRVDADMLQASRDRVDLLHAIQEGVDNEQFTAWFQPKVDTLTGDIVGLEALARWNYPERGVLSPQHFIDVAEESELIVMIGEQILRESIKAHEMLVDFGWQGSISINASARELKKPDYASALIATLSERDVRPSAISIELLETVARDDACDALEGNLAQFNSCGVPVWIDDFGVGYSTISVLQHEAFEGIKIDRRFVCDESSSEGDKVLLDAIVRMGQAMGKVCVLEGVETAEQSAYARRIGCSVVQVLPWKADAIACATGLADAH